MPTFLELFAYILGGGTLIVFVTLGIGAFFEYAANFISDFFNNAVK